MRGVSRIWVRIAAALVILAILVAAGVGAASAYKRRTALRMLADARSLAAVGQWQKAKNLYGFYLLKHPSDLDVMREFANASLRIVENRRAAVRDAAGALYQIALAEAGSGDTALGLLRMLEHHAYWADLEYYASGLLRVDPGNQSFQYYRAYALDRLARNEEARAAYQRLVDLKTEVPDVYGNLARLYERQGQPTAADDVLNNAEPLNASPGMAELQRARLETARQHFDQARELLKQAQDKGGTNAGVCRAGAELEMTSRNWTQAVAWIEQCRALEPDSPEYYVHLALALQRKDKRDAAVDLIREMDPLVRASSPEIMAILCEIYIDQNQLEEAEAAAADYVRSWPDHLLVHQYLQARVILARGDTAGAIERLTAVARGNPQMASARYFLAIAHLRQGDYEGARASVESLLRDFPQDEGALALREVLFSGDVPSDQAVARAQSLLSADDAEPEQLVSAARALLRPSMSDSQARGNLDAAESAAATGLLWRAVELAPGLAPPYQLLVRHYVDVGDLAQARRALDHAAAAGADLDQMAKERFLVALASRNTAQAAVVVDQVAAQPDLPAQTAVEFAAMACGAGQTDLGVDFLKRVADRQPDQGPLLRVEACVLLARAGLHEKALEILESHAGDFDGRADSGLREARLRLARTLAAPGNTERMDAAARLVASVRNDAPDDFNGLLADARIRALRTPPDYEAARELVGRVLSTSPSHPDALLLLAQLDFAEGRGVEALEGVRAAAALAPRNTEILSFKADVEQALHKTVDARETLRELLAAAPANMPAAVKLFENYCSSGDVRQAEEMLKRIESAGVQRASVNLDRLRAQVAVVRGKDMAEAERILREQYRMKPEPGVLKELAGVLTAAGKRDELERVLLDAAEGALKDSPDPWALLAEFYLAGEDPAALKRASSAVTRSLLLAPEHPGAMRAGIRLFLREGNPGGALGMCRRYLKAQPNDANVLSQEAALLASTGRPAEALESIERALQISDQPGGRFIRATVLLTLGRYEEALADLQRAAGGENISPCDHDAAMAEAYLGLKEPETARRYYDAGIEKAKASGGPAPDSLKKLKLQIERSSP